MNPGCSLQVIVNRKHIQTLSHSPFTSRQKYKELCDWRTLSKKNERVSVRVSALVKCEGSSTKGADLALAASPLTAGVRQAHHHIPAFSISLAEGFQDFLCDEWTRWPPENFLLVVSLWKTQFSGPLQDGLNGIVTEALWGFVLMGVKLIFKDIWWNKMNKWIIKNISLFT